MLKAYVKHNVSLMAIIVYIIAICIPIYTKPAFLYKSDGTLREFGLGYKNKTILPLWLYAIITGILSYLFVRYYAKY